MLKFLAVVPFFALLAACGSTSVNPEQMATGGAAAVGGSQTGSGGSTTGGTGGVAGSAGQAGSGGAAGETGGTGGAGSGGAAGASSDSGTDADPQWWTTTPNGCNQAEGITCCPHSPTPPFPCGGQAQWNGWTDWTCMVAPNTLTHGGLCAQYQVGSWCCPP